MIPRRVNLPGVYPSESISPDYHTPASQSKIHQNMTPRGIIPSESVFFKPKIEWLSEVLTQIENILTHWSVAQADWNNEKYEGWKSHWT